LKEVGLGCDDHQKIKKDDKTTKKRGGKQVQVAMNTIKAKKDNQQCKLTKKKEGGGP
jgi:hypothetical protein